MRRITILLAEDHTVVREGIRKMLELEPDLSVVGEAADGRQAVDLAKKLCPSVVLMDIAMPGMNGLEATRQVLKALPSTKVVVLSSYSDDVYVKAASDFGAVGFLLKQSSASDVCRAVRKVQSGELFFSPLIAKRLACLNLRLNPRADATSGKRAMVLTSRETEVLQLIAEGKANKQIAGDLDISIKTVEKHRARLMSKLGIHDIAGLTRYAMGAGIIENQAGEQGIPRRGK